MREHEPNAPLVLHLDDQQWAWLRATGAPVEALLSLVDRAIRADIVKRALRDEHTVELLIRRQHKDLKRRFGSSQDLVDGGASLRVVAEDTILASCETMHDAVMRAAAARLRLLFKIQQGQVRDSRRARAALQRLREQRPGGWRELIADRTS